MLSCWLPQDGWLSTGSWLRVVKDGSKFYPAIPAANNGITDVISGRRNADLNKRETGGTIKHVQRVLRRFVDDEIWMDSYKQETSIFPQRELSISCQTKTLYARNNRG